METDRLLERMELGAAIQGHRADTPREAAYFNGASEVLGAMRRGSDMGAAIEAQEAAGQRCFVASETLPKDGTQNRTPWEALGFQFGEDADDLFVRVKFPEGWRKQETSHSMWSDLLDAQGRRRAGIFYKAAFYDRSAHVSLSRRYSSGTQPVGGWGDDGDHSRFVGVVRDGEQVIFTTKPTSARPGQKATREADLAWYAEKDQRAAEADAWLQEHFPAWADPLAYWD